MYVAGKQITVAGSPRRRGDPVPEAADWPDYVRQAAINVKEILDVTTDVAAQIQIEEFYRDAVAALGRAERGYQAAIAKAELIKDQYQQAREQAAELEKQADEAIAQALEAKDKVAACRSEVEDSKAARDGALSPTVPGPSPSQQTKKGKK